MCRECFMTPCHAMCPNYEPVYIDNCAKCGAGLTEDDGFLLDDENELLCEDCYEDYLWEEEDNQ